MKKNTIKALFKSARTSARKSLYLDIWGLLESKLGEHNQGSKKLKKEIKKASKKLAKRLTRNFEYDKEALIAMQNEIEVTAISGPVKTADTKTRKSKAVDAEKTDLINNSYLLSDDAADNRNGVSSETEQDSQQKRPVKATGSIATSTESPRPKNDEVINSVSPTSE
ncbi:MAG TPA: hypothetical protein VGB63_08905 [Pedobacter sp.]|jgi:plasmid maintenance system antidote protein VapI